MGHVKHGLIEWTLIGVIIECLKPLFHLSSKIYREKESEMENETEGTVSKMAVWCGSGRVRACGRAAAWRAGGWCQSVSHSRALAAAAVGVSLCVCCECSCRAFSSHHVRFFQVAPVPTGLRSS